MKLIRSILLGGTVPSFLAADVVLTAVRIFTGLALALAHGWGKVRDPEGIIGMTGQMGVPFETLFGWAAALTEFVGGLLLAAGLLTRAAAFFIFINMTVAWLGWHWLHADDKFGDMELALLFWFIALQFVVIGSGRFGVDRFLR